MKDQRLLSGLIWRMAVIGVGLLLAAAVVYALAALIGLLANA